MDTSCLPRLQKQSIDGHVVLAATVKQSIDEHVVLAATGNKATEKQVTIAGHVLLGATANTGVSKLTANTVSFSHTDI